jgi:regulator of sigma E protease
MLGITALKPLVAAVPDGTIAHRAGLRGEEQVIQVGNEPIVTWNELRTELLKAALTKGQMALRARNKSGDEDEYQLDFSQASADPEKLFPELGLEPFEPRYAPLVVHIESGSAAAAAGLQEQDRLLGIDGKEIENATAFVEWARANPGKEAELRVRRGSEEFDLKLRVGSMPEDLWQDLRAVRKYGPIEAFPAALVQTWDLSILTLKLMGRMVVGDVSLRNVSGPIQIAQYAGYTASIGLVSFLSFLAVVSISLAVLNLLPVPVLDGGHLLYYGIEMIKGSPLSEQAQAFGQKIGLVLLIMLMCLAFYNDITRLLAG